MLARTPRNLGQFEEFVDLFGGTADAYAFDTYQYFNDISLPDLSFDEFANFDFDPAAFDIAQFDPADFALPTLEPFDIGVPEIESAFDVVDVETMPLDPAPVIEVEPLPAIEDMTAPAESTFDIEDMEAGTQMRQAQVAQAEEVTLMESGSGAYDVATPSTLDADAAMRAAARAAQTLPSSGGALPAATSILDTAARIAAAGAMIYATKAQADIAASRANLAQPGGAARFKTAIDPATGRAVVVDTLTGKAVTLDPATGLPVQTGFSGALDQAVQFVKANAFPLAAVGAILAVMLMRSPTARRARHRARQRILKRGKS